MKCPNCGNEMQPLIYMQAGGKPKERGDFCNHCAKKQLESGQIDIIAGYFKDRWVKVWW